MYAFFKTLGISILIMCISSFIGILLMKDVLVISIFVLSVTYFFNGFFSAKTNNIYPYFAAYMSALVLIFINYLFSYLLLDLNVFINSEIIFSSLLTGTVVSLLGAQVQIFLRKRRLEHV